MNDDDIDMDDETPIDLKGSEQHHKLKNQPGEKGDPDHALGNKTGASDKKLKGIVSDGSDRNAVGSAMKKAAKDQ